MNYSSWRLRDRDRTVCLLMAAGQITEACSHLFRCLLEFGLISRWLFLQTLLARRHLTPIAAVCCSHVGSLDGRPAAHLQECTFLFTNSAPTHASPSPSPVPTAHVILSGCLLLPPPPTGCVHTLATLWDSGRAVFLPAGGFGSTLQDQCSWWLAFWLYKTLLQSWKLNFFLFNIRCMQCFIYTMVPEMWVTRVENWTQPRYPKL